MSAISFAAQSNFSLKYLHVTGKWQKDLQMLKFRRLKNGEKMQETKILRKIHQPGSMSGPAGLKTRI